uniref:Uncharacterized protein n=1 Tax=Peronospora matthiolae TaxID=2874970 RepID=A0AAV1U915_9STRA
MKMECCQGEGKKDPDAVNQKPRVENVNALLDIHMDRTSNENCR